MFYTQMSMCDAAIALSHDVEFGPNGQLRFAEFQWKTAPPLGLFTDLYLDGLAAAIRLGLKRLVIVGGRERRYPHMYLTRPEAICEMLECGYDTGSCSIEVLESDPDTIGNAQRVKEWFQHSGIDYRRCIGITTAWHVERASVIFEGQGLSLPFFVAENFFLRASSSPTETHERLARIVELLRRPGYQARIEAEQRGVNAYLSGNYHRRAV